jgi:opacity protein-like surface antigen
MTEFNFLNFITGSRNRKFTPYLSFGVGYLYRMDTLLNQNTSDLSAPTSPNKVPLNLTFPLNLGFKFNVYRRFNILGEATYRYTSMDDLDFLTSSINTPSGYQGSASGNDRFFSAKLGISYTFNRIYGMEKNEPKKSKGLLNRFKRK